MGCGVDFNAHYNSGYVNVSFTKNGEQVRKGSRGDAVEVGGGEGRRENGGG